MSNVIEFKGKSRKNENTQDIKQNSKKTVTHRYLIINNALILLGTIMFLGFSLYLANTALISEGLNSNLPADHSYFNFLNYQFNHTALYIIGASLFSTVFATAVTFYGLLKKKSPLNEEQTSNNETTHNNTLEFVTKKSA